MASGWQVRALFLAAVWAFAGGARTKDLGGGSRLEASLQQQAKDEQASASDSVCVPLKNEGMAFSVNVEIGTPKQGPFRLIADTGSNALVVQSCFCGSSGNCTTTAETRCYVGTNTSTTFAVFGENGWETPIDGQASSEPLVRKMSYGSGDIQSVVVKDEVCVGSLCTAMDDAFLSIIQVDFDIQGPTIEGIAGLGLPSDEQPESEGGSPAGEPRATSFLEQAGVKRFSICFNENADGVLRLGTPEPAHALGSWGKLHWGLGVDGISLVDAAGSVAPMAIELCTPADMGDQDTPCGIIPDSGTTGITAPPRELAVIEAAICDAWPRCQSTLNQAAIDIDAATESVLEAVILAKAEAFRSKVKDCASWLDSGEGAAELPTLRFHLTGKGGGEQDINLPGNAYIYETQQEEMLVSYEDTPEGPVEVETPTGNWERVCVPALDEMPYDTPLNGPVFILGTPLFYEYTLDYDLSTDTPGVAFTSTDATPCGACVVEPDLMEVSSGRQRQRLRRVDGPLRKPSLDVTLPL